MICLSTTYYREVFVFLLFVVTQTFNNRLPYRHRDGRLRLQDDHRVVRE